MTKKINNFNISKLYIHSKKLLKRLYLFCLLSFIISFIINLNLDNNIFNAFINSLTISLLFFPSSIIGLYKRTFNNQEGYCYIKTVITKTIPDKKIIKKLNKSGINIIILSTEDIDLKIKTITIKEISPRLLTKNLIINTTKFEASKYFDNENSYIVTENISNLYDRIHESRGVYDNYLRTIKHTINVYITFGLSNAIFYLSGFPCVISLPVILSLKLYTLISNELVIKKLPFDTDIDLRKPKDENIFLGKQEIMLLFMQIMLNLFALTLPYMYLLANGSTNNLTKTIYIITFIYLIIFNIIINLSEKPMIKNIIKSFLNIRTLLNNIFLILLTIIINYLHIFKANNIGLKNYISCIIISFVFVLVYDLTKLARYTSTKGVIKNEHKNNKKY